MALLLGTTLAAALKVFARKAEPDGAIRGVRDDFRSARIEAADKAARKELSTAAVRRPGV